MVFVYVSSGLRDEKTISRHIISVADPSHEQIKELLLTPLKEKSINNLSRFIGQTAIR